jgi:hypothetical protein
MEVVAVRVMRQKGNFHLAVNGKLLILPYFLYNETDNGS